MKDGMAILMRNVLYFFYFVKTTDYNSLFQNMKKVRNVEGLSYFQIAVNIIKDSLKYKASFSDYFVLEFYKKDHKDKEGFVTTGLSHEFHSKMNNKSMVDIFRDKVKFINTFKKYINRDLLLITESSHEDFNN